jgi:hypothetical protein
MAQNPQIADSEKAPYTLVELDAASQPVPGVSTDVISITTDSPNSVSIVPDATPAPGTVASGFIVGGVPKAGVVITAQVTHADGTTLGPAIDTVDIVGGVANSLAFGLGAPIPK